ncbi:hypothetical protein EDB86DRAFT_2976423, partial [Lactarius hatsudake]
MTASRFRARPRTTVRVREGKRTTRRDRSRVCGKHRTVLRPRSPPRIPFPLARGCYLRQAQTFDFMFKNVEKQYESYLGINVKLRFV